MTALFKLLAGHAGVWLLGLALAVGMVWGGFYLGSEYKDAEWQARWAVRDAGDQQAWALADGQARTEEQRRQTAINQVANDARTQQAAAINDAVHADTAGDRLHVAAAELASRASCTGSDPGIADRSASTRRAALVLSDLLSRADKRAGELAAAYDRARIAGITCEAAYQSLSAPRR